MKTTMNDFQFQQHLVDKFVATPKNWGVEIKMAKSLLKKHGREVWSYVRLTEVVNSLMFFGTAKGIDCLKKAQESMRKMSSSKNVVDFDENIEYKRVTVDKLSLKKRLIE